MPDNVQQFPGVAVPPDNPLELVPRRDYFCQHESVRLDAHTRTVTCADPKCCAVLDPFSFLVSNARTIQTAWSSYRAAKASAVAMAERVTALKKEEQRLRAQIKRLQEKVPVVNVRSREDR